MSETQQTYPNAGPNCEIPAGIYYSVDADNFYNADRRGMGHEFFRKWHFRRYEFPKPPWDAADSPDAGKMVEPTVSALLAVPETSVSTFNHQSIDAREWAAEFCRLFPGHDEGLMLGWFANAIMAGYDEAMRRTRQPQPTTADAAVKDSLTVPPAPEPTLLEAAERAVPQLKKAARLLSDGYRFEVMPLVQECLKSLTAAVERIDAMAANVGAQTHADWLRITAYSLQTYTSRERLRAIADDLEAKDRTIAALTAERDRLREAYDAGVPGWMARIDGELITTTLTENPGELAASLNGPHEIVAVRIVEVTEPLTRPDPSAGS